MKRNFLLSAMFIAVMMITCASVYAQRSVVMLHHEGVATPFYDGTSALVNAYEAAVDGDTIYLPGGTFSQPSNYSKGIHVYGAGFYPDSTAATGSTILNGGLVLVAGSDNFHVEGVQISDGIKIGTGNDTISHVRVVAVRFTGIIASHANACITDAQFIQCVITGQSTLNKYSNSCLKNCIFTGSGRILESNSNVYENNVLISSASSNYSYRYLINGDNNLIKNNVFIGAGDGALDGNANLLYNNINCTSGTNNVCNVSPYSVPENDIFVNYTSANFSYEQDYHLQNPDAYIGTDGTQVGIYGGEHAWTGYAMPTNPHVREINAATQTDENGMLQINIKVGAK